MLYPAELRTHMEFWVSLAGGPHMLRLCSPERGRTILPGLS